jgi:hypothetical protein
MTAFWSFVSPGGCRITSFPPATSFPRKRESTASRTSQCDALRPGNPTASHVISATHVIPAKAGIHYNNETMSRQYHVYILASKPNGTLYIGVTNNIARRV